MEPKKSSKNIEEILSDIYAVTRGIGGGIIITLNNKYGQHNIMVDKMYSSKMYVSRELIAGMQHITGLKKYAEKILKTDINTNLSDIQLEFYEVVYLKDRNNNVIYQSEKK